jgi:hypothetical protein
MWDRTCIPHKGYQVLYPCKRHFRCAQAQHFLVLAGQFIPVRHSFRESPPRY